MTTQITDLGAPDESGARRRNRVSGAGVSIDNDEARFLALVEGLERYSAGVFSKEQFVRASAEELGKDALDLDSVARCSEVELAHPKCTLVAPDKKIPIRWVRGLSLANGRVVYIPVVMTYVGAGYANNGERFWHPISTGCAAHTSYERAIVSAALEMVERDAISIVWLHQLPLPRIEINQVPEALEGYWALYEESSKDLEYLFFDATLDLGFPTVYGLQIAHNHERLRTLVSCSTDLNPAAAVAKAIREMAAMRIALGNTVTIPESFDDFHEILDGAAYMAKAAQADSFRFLLESRKTRPLSEIPVLTQGIDEANLRFVLERLKAKEIDAYVVDLSTDEALRAGLRIVRVIVPRLQPLSFHYRAKYLGNPRLYEAPEAMGYPALSEEQLNQWPQPFA